MLPEPLAAGGRALAARIDPRVRLVAALAYSSATAVWQKPASIAAALVFALALAVFFRLSAGSVLRRLFAVNGFIALLWLFLPFSLPGEALLRLGPLAASRDGVLLAFAITLKSNALVLALLALVAPLSLPTAGHALHRLGAPGKLVQLLLLTWRYLALLEQEFRRLRRAAALRGFRPRTDLHTYRTFAWLLGMLLVRAVDRAERVRRAMVCRGFQGVFFSLHEFHLGRGSLAFAAAVAAAVAASAALEFAR